MSAQVHYNTRRLLVESVPARLASVTVQASPYTAGGRTFTFDEPCDYFTYGKAKASTLSLSVLVAIEMFNAMNALSEVRNSSLSSTFCYPQHVCQQLVLILGGKECARCSSVQEPTCDVDMQLQLLQT